MGTNFYWAIRPADESADDWDHLDDDHPRRHIGKRSASGFYCWDCGVTFCRDGSGEVHYGKNRYTGRETEWYDACPNCGAGRPDKPSIATGTGGVELGFAKSRDLVTSGVQTCASFTWTMLKHKSRLQALRYSDAKVVRDEYGREFTAEEFLAQELRGVAIETQYYGNFS